MSAATTATVLTALATMVLAIVTLVSAVYAARGFAKQAQELDIVQYQVRDQHEQLELQRQQLDEQRKINELQAKDLKESLTERERLRRIAEREQANDVGFTWWPSSHVLIMNPPAPLPLGTPRHPRAVTAADASGMSVLVVDNASRRRILNAACRIEPSDGAGLTLAAERTGQLTDAKTQAHRATLNFPAEDSTVPLIRAGSQYGFLLRFDLEKNPDARLAARFTDDAGLHWQIDQDLHLQPLDNRDW
jgi:hypothetical protein